jgi:hypothetical protein
MNFQKIREISTMETIELFKIHLETFRKYTSISYLHHFAVLYTYNYKNILYFPNLDTHYNILGKWSSNWYNLSKYILGYVEKDDHQNIILHISVCYTVCDDESLNYIDYTTFLSWWKQYYISDPLLNIVYFNVSEENYLNNYSITFSKANNLFIETQDFSESSITISPKESSPKSSESSSKSSLVISSSPITTPKSKLVKTIDIPKTPVCETNKSNIYSVCETNKSNIYSVCETNKSNIYSVCETNKSNIYLVCKTDKSDVYWVYNKNKEYISTCLIPNIKTSKYMNELFSSRSSSNFLELELKYHEKTSKYIPVIN